MVARINTPKQIKRRVIKHSLISGRRYSHYRSRSTSIRPTQHVGDKNRRRRNGRPVGNQAKDFMQNVIGVAKQVRFILRNVIYPFSTPTADISPSKAALSAFNPAKTELAQRFEEPSGPHVHFITDENMHNANLLEPIVVGNSDSSEPRIFCHKDKFTPFTVRLDVDTWRAKLFKEGSSLQGIVEINLKSLIIFRTVTVSPDLSVVRKSSRKRKCDGSMLVYEQPAKRDKRSRMQLLEDPIPLGGPIQEEAPVQQEDSLKPQDILLFEDPVKPDGPVLLEDPITSSGPIQLRDPLQEDPRVSEQNQWQGNSDSGIGIINEQETEEDRQEKAKFELQHYRLKLAEVEQRFDATVNTLLEIRSHRVDLNLAVGELQALNKKQVAEMQTCIDHIHRLRLECGELQ